MGLSDWVKLEVIPDQRYLFPDPEETLMAARILVGEGCKVLPYINADPVLAKKLQELGTVTVMPLGSPIGSGQGLQTLEQIRLIAEAIKEGVEAGRKAYVAGRMPRRGHASASSPTEGISRPN